MPPRLRPVVLCLLLGAVTNLVLTWILAVRVVVRVPAARPAAVEGLWHDESDDAFCIAGQSGSFRGRPEGVALGAPGEQRAQAEYEPYPFQAAKGAADTRGGGARSANQT